MRKGERAKNTVKNIILPQTFSAKAMKTTLEKAHISFIESVLKSAEYSDIEYAYIRDKMIEKL